MTSENDIDIGTARDLQQVVIDKTKDRAPVYKRFTEEKPHQGVPGKHGTDMPYV